VELGLVSLRERKSLCCGVDFRWDHREDANVDGLARRRRVT
jgi:hypothetical protein